jgi:membrane-associated protease RseP (regulator of RpoE activity)
VWLRGFSFQKCQSFCHSALILTKLETKEFGAKIIARHTGLFLLTLLSTTLAGAEWQHGKDFFYGEQTLGFDEFCSGFYYSIPFLLILSVHEFGHYIVAKKYDLAVTLPYFIPLWLSFLGIYMTIGTMGAVIQIKSSIDSRKIFFDVGIAGPLAGFVVALAVLFYAFTHLPAPEHIFTIHPEYQQYGLNYADFVYTNQSGNIALGTNLLFEFFKHFVASDAALVPNPYEIIHYPFFLAGYLALFFTALNLLPVGQLDGGHVIYGLFGSKRHKIISQTFFTAFVFYAGLGLFTPFDDSETLLLYAPLYILFLSQVFRSTFESQITALVYGSAIFALQFAFSAVFIGAEGYSGWLLFAFLLGRILGTQHPETLENQPLSTGRKILAWLGILVFILCFSPQPFVIQ